MDKSINQRIASLRRLANLTQYDVAEKIGMKCSTYSQMERKGNISAQMVLRLADIFGVHPNEILYGTDSLATQSTQENILPISQPKPPVPTSPPPIILTNSEESIIKIIRNLSKADKDEVMAFIEDKYKKRKK